MRDKDCLFGGPGPGAKETLSPRLLLALLLRFALQDKIGSFISGHNSQLFNRREKYKGHTYLYYNSTKEGRILASRQKKYELLENMKNPSYIGQNKYENLEEPSRTSHTRSSYFLNPLVKSCQIFILIQSPSKKSIL